MAPGAPVWRADQLGAIAGRWRSMPGRVGDGRPGSQTLRTGELYVQAVTGAAA